MEQKNFDQIARTKEQFLDEEIPEYLKNNIDHAYLLRQRVFGESINILDFFLYGNINSLAPEAAHFYAGSGIMTPYRRCQIRKTDSTIEHISSGSTSSYISALLPKSYNSISVAYELTPEEEKENLETNKEEKKATSIEATANFRDFLRHYVGNFTNTIHTLVRDYIDYGNCVSIWYKHKNKTAHIPFKNSYFMSPYGKKSFFFMYKENVMRHEIYGNDQSNPDIITLLHVFTNDRGYFGETLGVMDKHYLEIIIDENKNKIIDYNTYDYNPIFIARNNTTTNLFHTQRENLLVDLPNLYGRGAGIQSITSIVNANYAIQMLNLGSALAVHPATILSKGFTLNNGEGFEENVLVVEPGFCNTIDEAIQSPAKGGSNGGFNTVGQPEQVLRSFGENYQLHLKQIETAYNTEIFSVAAVHNQTATEVVQRQEQAVRQFRGLASPFYNQLLLPMLNVLYEYFAQIYDYPITQYKINIFSFEDEQQREINATKMERYIANIVQLASSGIPIPGIEKKIAMALEKMEDFYISKDM